MKKILKKLQPLLEKLEICFKLEMVEKVAAKKERAEVAGKNDSAEVATKDERADWRGENYGDIRASS